MKTLVIILLALVAATGSGFAQNLIAVQNGGEPTFYADLDAAIVNAQNGDTLYLPSGIFKLNQTIDKTLHIIGNGYHPDISTAPGLTYIINEIIITEGASNGSITGVLINYRIWAAQGNTTNYSVSRCFTNSIEGNFSGSVFSENIIKNNFWINGTECSFFNNIIESSISNFPQLSYCTYKNNLFLGETFFASGWTVPVYTDHSIFENNIFLATNVNPISICSQSVFRNNLFVYNWEGPDNQSYWFGSGNMVNVSKENIFVNQSGNAFDYAQVYHIKDSSPGKNGGVDGTDVGIYGGIYPWKEGGLPFNPQIQVAKIAGTTNANGNLNVNIKVAAQER